MNVELRRRTTEWVSAPVAATARVANDNRAPRQATARSRALIYRPARSATTSGRAGTRRWVLEFEPRSPPFIEPLMGWTGSTDPLAGLRLSFPNVEAAMRFAERQGIAYEVCAPAETARRQAETPTKAGSRLAAVLPVKLPQEPGALRLEPAVPEPALAASAA